MPKRNDIKSILVIGSGPIVIGQACEFDYSGNQALRALREEGYRTILINSNPATIMTDPDSADAVYIEPLTTEFVEKIIIKEKPDAILPTMGGQTALNLAVALEEQGILKKHNIALLGANVPVIKKAENRDEFRQCMIANGLDVPKSQLLRSVDEAEALMQEIPFPLILRPSFTLGGAGGATVNNKEEFLHYLAKGLELSPTTEVLVEESLFGWKEYELEVVRDKKDNVIIVCSIENLDPMGVHTGDSITVAPSQTLTDAEYQRMRDMAVKIIRAIGVETGGSNIQFAVDPKTGRTIVIEMNPRVSRSSALASKATGFPIAKVAARLAVGYTLDELTNDVTKSTPASFEPTLDYVVVKIPRFNFEKFQSATPELNTTMKSVGEVMSIGSTFKEAFLKALASLENNFPWLKTTKYDEGEFTEEVKQDLFAWLKKTHHQRIFYVVTAMRRKIPIEKIYEITKIDPWFLRQLEQIIEAETELKGFASQNPKELLQQKPYILARAKAFGFTDRFISLLVGLQAEEIHDIRRQNNIHPQYRAVDTCAAEFVAHTPYLYSSYANWNNSSTELEVPASKTQNQKTVMILGGGPNRIGQGIEFDYCCVHSAMSLQAEGYRVIMINCNPETVSTDADISDRLYFEPVTAESVLEIARIEKPLGVIVQFGGQTPLKIAHSLAKANLTILGTSVDSIDLAEDRKRCEELAKKLGLKQPANATATNETEALAKAKELGLPVLIRPSYVLGGRAMKICYNEEMIKTFAAEALEESDGRELYLDRFLQKAVEVDIDVLCDQEQSVVGGLMEHIEEAGIHSGDSSCAIPPFTLSNEICEKIRSAAKELALSFKVKGLMNAQFAVHDNEIYLIEVNPRASRTVPFVSKAIGKPLAKIATQLMVGKKLKDLGFSDSLDKQLRYSNIKGAVFPFDRFDHTDTILGPEMRSTGEVMGRANDFGAAFAKSLLANSMQIPKSGTIFLSVRDEDKKDLVVVAKQLKEFGFDFVATKGTYDILLENNIESTKVLKFQEGSPNCVDMLKEKRFILVINTTSDEKAIEDSFWIRRSALETHVPCITTMTATNVLIKAMHSYQNNLEVYPL